MTLAWLMPTEYPMHPMHPMGADGWRWVLNGRPVTPLRQQTDASLKRLGTDYIDLMQIHRFDPAVPVPGRPAIPQRLDPCRSRRLPQDTQQLGSPASPSTPALGTSQCAERFVWQIHPGEAGRQGTSVAQCPCRPCASCCPLLDRQSRTSK